MSTIAAILGGSRVPNEHADVLLELAYLMAAADGRLDRSELGAYRDVVARVRGVASVSEADLDALLDRFAGNVDHEEITARVRELSPTLPAPLKETAYKLAIALSLVDLDASRDEEKVGAALAEALGLSPERQDELTAEVYGALDAGSD